MTQPMAGPSGPNGSRRAGVDGLDDGEVDAVDRQPVLRLDLLHRPEAHLRGELPEAARHDERGLAGDLAEGRQVEVVVVTVADEHGVEVGEQLREHGADLAANGADAVAQDGVGEDAQVVDLDQHRRVAQERDPRVGGTGLLRGGAARGPCARRDRRRQHDRAWGHRAPDGRAVAQRGRRLRLRARCRTLTTCRRHRRNRPSATSPVPPRRRPPGRPGRNPVLGMGLGWIAGRPRSAQGAGAGGACRPAGRPCRAAGPGGRGARRRSPDRDPAVRRRRR